MLASQQVPTTFEEFCERLSHWRIIVDDDERAWGLYLSHGYLHLLPYLEFLRYSTGSMSGAFRPIDELCALVALDAKLRLIIFEGIGIVEVQAKAQYAQAMHAEYGAGGIEDPAHFRHARKQANFVKSMASARRRRSALGTQEDSRAFGDWACAHLASLGEFAILLGDTRSARVRQQVAESFDANSRCFADWLRCLADVRNSCAHASAYCVRAQIPREPKPVRGFEGDDPTRPLYVLVLIEQLLRGRVRAKVPGADDELFRFAEDASMLLGAFAQAHPGLAHGLAIPRPYLELRGKLPLGTPPAPRGASATSYGAIPLTA